MREYLDFAIDTGSDAFVAAFDELTLWSATAGLLLLRHVPLTACSVLDVGCGTGFPLLELAERSGPSSRVVGVDVWAPALQRAAMKAKAQGASHVEVVACDAASLPFEDDAFDVIVSNLGLNNFDDAPAVMRACARVLRPGGTVAITTNLVGHMQSFHDVFATVLHEHGDVAALERLATAEGVQALFAGAGLEVTRVEHQNSVMRFSSGSAFLHSHFVKISFMNGWKSVVEESRRAEIFAAIEARLNELGALAVTVPFAYLEARAAPTP